MIKRTTNRRNPVFRLYGGRGIKVCARWRHDFAAFLSDMGRRPSALHSIDRIDNEGDYEPRNCRWATPKEQSGNTRRNRWLEFNGRRMICSDWAAEMGMSPQTLYKRLKAGWSVSRSLTAPVVARP